MRQITESDEGSTSRVHTITNMNETVNSIPNLDLSGILQDPHEVKQSYKEELLAWVKRATAYFFCFILVQLSLLHYIPSYLALLPLVLFDCFLLYRSFSTSPPQVLKFLLSFSTIHQLCSLTIKIMLSIYLGISAFTKFLFIIPLIITCFFDLLNRVPKDRECRYLTWLVTSK